MQPLGETRRVNGSFVARVTAVRGSPNGGVSNISIDTDNVPPYSLSRTSSGNSSGSTPTPRQRRSSNASNVSSARRSPNPSPALDRASDTTVRRLLASGMSVHSNSAANALASAATIGEMGLVRALVKAGVPVDAVYHGSTALMAAASGGELDVVQFLSRHHAEVDFRGPDGTTALYLASRGGYADVVTYLLHRKANADVATATGKSALHAAVQGGFTAIVRELLGHWASTQRVDGTGRLAREYVIAENQEIANLLDAFDRKTALLNAAAIGNLEAVKFLVGEHYDLETCGPEDETALLVAAGGGAGRVEIARVLLEAGADRSAALKDGSSALHLAVKTAGARGGASMVALLLQEGVDPRSLDMRGNRAHDYADDPHVLHVLERHDRRMVLLFAAEAGNLSLVMHHVEHNAPIDARGRADGVTPLIAAVGKGFIDVARYLLEKGADANATSIVGCISALHIAAQQNDYEMAECLLEHGANACLRNAAGKLAQDYATDNFLIEMLNTVEEVGIVTGADEVDDEQIVEPSATNSFISNKSSVNSSDIQNERSENGNIPILADDKQTERVDEIVVPEALNTPIAAGARLQHVTRQVVKTGQNDLNLENTICSHRDCMPPPPSYNSYERTEGLSPNGTTKLTPMPPPTPTTLLDADENADTDQLLIAVQLNNLENVHKLLSHEGDLEVRSKRNNFTPLCWAAQAGNLEVVRCLLVEGAKMDAATPTGFTPLLLAAIGGHAGVVQHLLMKGANPEVCVTRSGFTPLLQAASKGHADVIRHLVKKHVNLETRSADGSTALHLAASMGHADVVQLLLTGGADCNAVTRCDGSTALHLAAFMNKQSVVRLLMRCGADPQLKDGQGLTAADLAHSNQLRRGLLATKTERDDVLMEEWWDQWRLHRPVAVSNAVVEGAA